MISSSQNYARLSNWILVIQCQWNVCGSPGVDALFLRTVHHSGESAQTQAASPRTTWQTGGVSSTLLVWWHAGAWHDLLTRERESAPKQQATNHISKKELFFIQSANGSPGQVGLSAVLFIWSPVMGMGASFLSDEKETKRKEGTERILCYITMLAFLKKKTIITVHFLHSHQFTSAKSGFTAQI